METKKLQEWLEIRTKMNVLSWDKISILYKKYWNNEIGDIELTLEIVKVLQIPWGNPHIIPNLYESEMNESFLNKLAERWEIIQKIVTEATESKKKSSEPSEDIKEH